MKRSWLVLLLLLFSGAALASASNPSIYSDAVANKTDISIAYLSSIFGSVSGVLNGTSGQMLGKLLYQFNQGLLVVAGCWLGFTVLTMVFKSAISGSFMQQDNKVPMILLRIAFGFGLLIPSPTTGYTVLQGIVMQVVVQSVKLANQVWEYGLDYMYNGGALWSQPVQQAQANTGSDGLPTVSKVILTSKDSTAIVGDPDAADPNVTTNFSQLSFVQKIMAMEACMVQASIDGERNNNADASDANGGITVDGSTASTAPLAVYEDLDHYRFEFPGGYSTQSSNGNRNVACGVVYWTAVAAKPNLNCAATPANDGSPTDDNTQCGFTRLALQEAINDLLPAVKQWVCINNGLSSGAVCGSTNSGSTDDSYMTDAMLSSTLNYVNLIKPLIRTDILDPSTTNNSVFNFYNQAKADGWMTAGRYYWNLLQVESAYSTKMGGKSYADYLPTLFTAPDSYLTLPGSIKTANALLAQTTGDDGYISVVNTDLQAFSGAADAGQTQAMKKMKTGNKWMDKIFSAIIPVARDVSSLIMLFSNQVGDGTGLGPQPILWLHQIGMACMSIAGNLWLTTIFALFPIVALFSTMSACSGLANAVTKAVDWIQPVILAAAAGFFAVGVVLGFYMPLYPYMLFTFGVIGWLIAVIEAMVAAPLVAMGITHPEGHDFLGRSQQVIMLLLGIFLRPVLMVIGLFAAMILCQVSLSIVIYTFAGFASDIFYNSTPMTGAPGGDVVLKSVGMAAGNIFMEGQANGVMALMMPLLVFPMFLGLFCMLVYMVTTSCFSLIHQLPDYIMTWIGGPQAHGAIRGDQMVERVSHGMSGTAAGSSQAMNQTVGPKGKEAAAKRRQAPQVLNAPDANQQGGVGN